MTDRKPKAQFRREAIVLCCLLLSALWCWREARALNSRQDTHNKLTAQVQQMRGDADVIRQLRAAPRIVAERERPNDTLIAQIRDAMVAAGVPTDGWAGHDPLPAVRIPQTPYKQLSVRVRFEDLSLKVLAQFALNLTQSDSTLSIPSLHLAAPRGGKSEAWDVNMTISYLIYSPYVDR